MREIKFRAWDTQYNQWAYFTLAQLVGGEVVHIAARCINWCLFTGLLDKHGKEIYEGDVVRYGVRQFSKSYGVVVWDKDGAEFRIKRIDSETGLAWSAYRDELKTEVIGNRYENSDLLAKGND